MHVQRSTTWFHERDRNACSWEMGSSATPVDLVERLLELGLVEDDEPPLGMALT